MVGSTQAHIRRPHQGRRHRPGIAERFARPERVPAEEGKAGSPSAARPVIFSEFRAALTWAFVSATTIAAARGPPRNGGWMDDALRPLARPQSMTASALSTTHRRTESRRQSDLAVADGLGPERASEDCSMVRAPTCNMGSPGRETSAARLVKEAVSGPAGPPAARTAKAIRDSDPASRDGFDRRSSDCGPGRPDYCTPMLKAGVRRDVERLAAVTPHWRGRTRGRRAVHAQPGANTPADASAKLRARARVPPSLV